MNSKAIESKKSMQGHIIIKLMKTRNKGKKKLSKVTRENNQKHQFESQQISHLKLIGTSRKCITIFK